MGSLRAGFRWDGAALGPSVELLDVAFEGVEHRRVDLLDGTSVVNAASAALEAAIHTAVGSSSTANALLALAGIGQPPGGAGLTRRRTSPPSPRTRSARSRGSIERCSPTRPIRGAGCSVRSPLWPARPPRQRVRDRYDGATRGGWRWWPPGRLPSSSWPAGPCWHAGRRCPAGHRAARRSRLRALARGRCRRPAHLRPARRGHCRLDRPRGRRPRHRVRLAARPVGTGIGDRRDADGRGRHDEHRPGLARRGPDRPGTPS